MIEIIEATSKKQMNAFATFPIKLYRKCKYYVPSFVSDEKNILDPKKNLSKGISDCKVFLAYKDGKLAGRIAGIINHKSNELHDEKCVRFSRIDFIEDFEVAKALINAVIKYGLENGCEKIHGPWGFDDTDREGMLTEGFDQLSNYATAYSYPYYSKFMSEMGFEKESEWIEFQFDISSVDPRYKGISEMLKGQGYRDLADTMSVKQIVKEYGDRFFDCYNKAYSQLDNFIPLTGEMKTAVLNQFASIINKKFFSVIVNTEDEVVAFGVGLPHIGNSIRRGRGRMLLAAIPILYNINRPKAVELALIGVDPKYRNYGLHAMVIDHFVKNLTKTKIKDIWMDPVLTTNSKMLQTWKGFEKTVRQRRQTYIKKLEIIE